MRKRTSKSRFAAMKVNVEVCADQRNPASGIFLGAATGFVDSSCLSGNAVQVVRQVRHTIRRVGVQAGPFDCQPKYVCQIGLCLPHLANILSTPNGLRSLPAVAISSMFANLPRNIVRAVIASQ
jgi:hypothetical protein